MDGGDSPRFQRQASCSCAPSMSRGYVRGGFDLAGDDYGGVFHGPPFGADADAAAYGSKADGYSASSAAVGLHHHGRPAAVAPRGCGTRLRACGGGSSGRRRGRCSAPPAGCVPLGFSSAAASREPYDAYNYVQNFDDGEAWVEEPENLSRSFSARFAVPSRVLKMQRVAV